MNLCLLYFCWVFVSIQVEHLAIAKELARLRNKIYRGKYVHKNHFTTTIRNNVVHESVYKQISTVIRNS